MPDKGLMHWRRTTEGNRQLYLKPPGQINWIHYSGYSVKAANPDSDMSKGWCVFQSLFKQGWKLINDSQEEI